MTKDEYITEVCFKNEITREEFDSVLEVEECNCSYEGCHGWLALPRKEALDKTHEFA